MRPIKHLLLGLIAVAGIFVAALYSSCVRDECKAQVCFTKGSSCSKGICQCPTGVYGIHCETEYRSKYAGAYKGKAPADTFTTQYHTLTFIAKTDDTANYNKMEVIWTDSAAMYKAPKLEITLTNTTPGGSQFFISDTTIFGGYKYEGKGSINGLTASMNISLVNAATGAKAGTDILEGYIRQ